MEDGNDVFGGILFDMLATSVGVMFARNRTLSSQMRAIGAMLTSPKSLPMIERLMSVGNMVCDFLWSLLMGKGVETGEVRFEVMG